MNRLFSRTYAAILGVFLLGSSLPIRAQETKAAPSKPPLDAGSEELVPLKLALPKPPCGSWILNLKSTNLEPPRKPGEERKMPLVPKGTTNLAVGKTVTTNQKEEPTTESLKMITDGKKDNSQRSDATELESGVVTIGPGLRYVQIGLGRKCDIYAVAVWHRFVEPGIYHDVVVRVADEPSFANGVRTVFNNDHDNSSELGAGKDKEYIESNEGKLIECKDIRGRYVRLYSNGNTTDRINRYTEVEVFGRPSGE